MSAPFSYAIQREQQARMTEARILELAQRRGTFSVSLRYRDAWLRARCGNLRGKGLLRGGGRVGKEVVYHATSREFPPYREGQ